MKKARLIIFLLMATSLNIFSQTPYDPCGEIRVRLPEIDKLIVDGDYEKALSILNNFKNNPEMKDCDNMRIVEHKINTILPCHEVNMKLLVVDSLISKGNYSKALSVLNNINNNPYNLQCENLHIVKEKIKNINNILKMEKDIINNTFIFDLVIPFSEGLAAVELNGKWGFIDKSGKFVIVPKYENARGFSEGLAAVKLNAKWGFIDKSGKEIIPIRYDVISSFSEGLAAINLDGKWGFIDKSGNTVIVPKYKEEKSFSEGLAAVKKNGKWGFVDKSGNVVIVPKYKDAESFSEGLAAINLDGKWGFIDKNGNTVIVPKYIDAKSFSEGLAYIGLKSREGYEGGFIDKSGRVIIGTNHRLGHAKSFSEGLAACDDYFIDKSGNTAFFLSNLSKKYGWIMAHSFSEGMACFVIGEKKRYSFEDTILKYGFIDKSGNEVIAPTYYNAMDYSEGFAAVMKSNHIVKSNRYGKWGFIDKHGKCLRIELITANH